MTQLNITLNQEEIQALLLKIVEKPLKRYWKWIFFDFRSQLDYKQNRRATAVRRHGLFCQKRRSKIDLPMVGQVNGYASMFALEGLTYLLTFDRLINTSKESGLTFRRLSPKLETKLYLAWNKNRPLTPIAHCFIEQVQDSFSCMTLKYYCSCRSINILHIWLKWIYYVNSTFFVTIKPKDS